MRYIENVIYEPVNDPIELGVDLHPASVGEVLLMALDTWQPATVNGVTQVLTLQQIGDLNRGRGLIRSTGVGEVIELEDTDFNVVRRVVEWAFPQLSTAGGKQVWSESKAVDDLLEAAPREKPEE